jgi:hypothetical protein
VRLIAAALLSLALLAQAAGADGTRTMTLTLPVTSAQPGRIAFLSVKLGVLPAGGEIDVTGPEGQMLGSLSPFALHAGTEAGTYALPVPAGYVHDGRITVHLSLRAGGTSRAPTDQEVKSVTATWGSASPQ